MAEEKRPAKKVVKRVVKKTVATPPASKEASPQVRYGRPVATAPKAKAAAPRSPASSPSRPKIAVSTKVKSAQNAITTRGSSAASGVAGAIRSGFDRVSDATSNGVRSVRSWRVPQWSPLPASIFTGVVVGLVAVALGLVAKGVFNELRGVSAGGGRWGSLTFVVVAFIAFVLGELLLSAFGSAQARLTSFLGVVLTIIAILGLFLESADSKWALIIVPALAGIAYVVAHWLVDLAESSPAQAD